MLKQTIEIIKDNLKNLKSKKILLIGITYLEGSDDIRSSPSLDLGRILKKQFNLNVNYYDRFYINQKYNLNRLNFEKDYFDAIVFCVKGSFSNVIFKSKMIKKTKLILDVNQIFDKKIINQLKKLNKKFIVLGNYKD